MTYPPLPNAASADNAAEDLGLRFASSWYLRVDDNIRITSYNATANVVLQIRHRFVDLSGYIQASAETQTPNTDRSAKSTIIETPEGWLLGGEVFVSGASPTQGQTFVVVEIVRGSASSALSLQLIAAGYVTTKQPLAFANGLVGSSLDGGGALRVIAGTQPAAGAEISETVPTGARWQLLSFKFTFTTSATVANRTSSLTIDDGANIFNLAGGNAVQAASATTVQSWASGQPNVANQPTNALGYPLATPLYLPAGARIRTQTLSIQAGDQYSAIQYLVREWIEGA